MRELLEKNEAVSQLERSLAEKDMEIEGLRGDITDLKEMYQENTMQLLDEIEQLKKR